MITYTYTGRTRVPGVARDWKENDVAVGVEWELWVREEGAGDFESCHSKR